MNKGLAAMRFSVLLCLGSVVDAGAQQSTTRGWVFGMDVGGTAISFQNEPSDLGGIVGARLGYGLNRSVTAYLGLYEADADVPGFDGFDKVTLGHLGLGVRLHLANSRRRWVPYGDLAMTLWPVTDALENGEPTTTGFTGVPTFSLGGGLALHLSEAWAVDVNFKWGRGLFQDVEVGNISAGRTSEHLHTFRDIDAASARLTIGFSWWP